MVLTLFVTAARGEPRELIILGWAENVVLTDPGFRLRAKLDTGAETSSLDARIIKKFRQGGKRWVRFAITNPKTGEEHVLVRQRVRTIGVVQHEGINQVRPTVVLQMCVADRLLDVEVSLVDRSEFTYRLLLGRSALEPFALIDPSATFLSRPRCKMPQTVEGKPT
ncbi:MAG: RimK/LysX family protein [Xanthomonadales bacterium]|nr:RimK/LysX family protein [Xanthomonadales bacterium]